MIRPLQCLGCTHLIPPPASGPPRYRCAAFPGGVPGPILRSDRDHREPYPGDRGIRLEPGRPGEGRR